MPNHTLPLDNDGIYHIYNKAVGREKLFQQEKHYLHFLQGFEKYLLPQLDIWSYCLLPNHFHLLVEIKEHSKGLEVSKAVSDCCNAHTKWINQLTDRKGNLFMRPFKRNKINDDAHLSWAVWYIHRNPLHHYYVQNIEDWKFSSYKAVGNARTKIASAKVLDFFQGYDNYVKFHQSQLSGYYDSLE